MENLKKEQCTCERPNDNTCSYCEEKQSKEILEEAKFNTECERFANKESNIISDWLKENGDPEITKQVEQEAEELCRQETVWAQERSYSEEEVYHILCEHTAELFKGSKVTLSEWFEKFKKK